MKRYVAMGWLNYFLPTTMLAGLLFCRGAASVQKSAELQDLCYAFLRNGDVYLACDGKKERLTVEGDVTHFAVAQDGSQFVLSRQRPSTPRKEGGEYDHNVQATYFLKQFTKSPREVRDAFEDLYASCGTILAYSDYRYGKGRAGDVESGTLLSFEPYTDFRCSSDRKTLVGTVDEDRRILRAGLPPSRDLVNAERTGHPVIYDVSPNGRYVGFSTYKTPYQDDAKLCLQEVDHAPVCLSKDNVFDRMAVSNSMGVFFVTGSDGFCYFRDMWHASRKPLPGYTGVDPCHAVAYWHPGDQAPRQLEFLGRNPQWLTPEAASALTAWATRRHAPPGVRH